MARWRTQNFGRVQPRYIVELLSHTTCDVASISSPQGSPSIILSFRTAFHLLCQMRDKQRTLYIDTLVRLFPLLSHYALLSRNAANTMEDQVDKISVHSLNKKLIIWLIPRYADNLIIVTGRWSQFYL